MKNAFIFPGQGAQKPGMGRDFFDAHLEAKEVFQEADEILSRALSRTIFEGPMELLTETRTSQPAIFVVSMAILRVLEKQLPELLPSMCGGLSLGEYTALCASHKLNFVETLRLVAKRGEYMQEACEQYPGTMLVVMGLSEEEIVESGAWIANVNCPGQIVVACVKEKVDIITKNLEERNAKRVIPLTVSGAFHSPLMDGAKGKLASAIETAPIVKSAIRLAMNVVGDFVEDPVQIKENLIAQVSSPTRWMSCVQAMHESGATHFYEIGPSQLTSMNRKIGVEGPTIGVEKVEDLEKVAYLE